MSELIYRCSDFAVVRKEYGELSEYDETRPNVISSVAQALSVSADSVYPVHRLDATTAGLTVYALTKDAARELSEAITDGRFHKTYIAFVTADERLPETGEMCDFLFFDRRAAKSYVVDSSKKGAKEARLTYSLGEKTEYKGVTVTKAKIGLQTGRTHQIRAQFGARKSPLVGDGKYGSRVNAKKPSLFSAAIKFSFRGEEFAFSIEDEVSFE